MKIQLDVSRKFKNKEGYLPANAYKLNTSFVTETHSLATFEKDVISQGWPYTMVHLKRAPEETGADLRGCTTPKNLDNFVSVQVATWDDDSKQKGVINGWLRDSFFSQYGWAFVESASSTSEQQKGHPTIIFDSPITSKDLYKECLEAFCWRHSRLDPLTNADRTIYNAEGAKIHMLGNICPFTVFVEKILTPYREQKRVAETKAVEDKMRRLIEWENAPKSEKMGDNLAVYVTRSIEGMMDWLAKQSSGRNRALNWVGYTVKGFELADWVPAECHSIISSAEELAVGACHANGYTDEYGGEKEARRVFNLGFSANSSRAAERPISRLAPVETITPIDVVHQAYLKGYADGWLDGFHAGLSVGRPFWHSLGMSDSDIGFFELGFCRDREALTVPYRDWEGELLNVEYNSSDYEKAADSLFITDASLTSAKYTLIVPSAVQAMRAWRSAGVYAHKYGIDSVIILASPLAPASPSWLESLAGIDTENIVYLARYGETDIPANLSVLSSHVKFARTTSTVAEMIDVSGFNWIDWAVKRAV